MDEERKTVWYWWLACERGCTWERTASTTTPDPKWATEGCPCCGAKFAGPVTPTPKVA